jgi:hypothetical protein
VVPPRPQRRLHQHRLGHGVDDEVAVRQRRLDDGARRGVVVDDEDADVAGRLELEERGRGAGRPRRLDQAVFNVERHR